MTQYRPNCKIDRTKLIPMGSIAQRLQLWADGLRPTGGHREVDDE